MKKSYFSGLSMLIAAFIFQIYCSDAGGILGSSHSDCPIVKFDAVQMGQQNLPGFDLVRSRAQWNCGREFVFQRASDQVTIHLTIGLHQSPTAANDVALDYLNEISIKMMEGGLGNAQIGDKFWWWSPNSDSENVTNILFLKENALFILSSHSYKNLVDLARTLDEDIKRKADYLKIDEAISVPKIESVSLAKSNLKEGDSIRIAIKATDPSNEPLEYQTQPGLIKFQGDPENVFTFVASRDQVDEPFLGSHKLKFVVINKSNVVSAVAERIVTIIP